MKKWIQFCLIAVLVSVATACSSDDDKTGGLELTSSVSQITADGADYVTFKVMNGAQDVTAQSIIYRGTTPIDGATFTSTTVGEYKFTAKYANTLSNEVTVKVVEVATYAKKALLPIWTSTNCVACPYMEKQLSEKWLTGRPNQIVPMYFHTTLMAEDDDPFIVKGSNGKVLFAGDMKGWFNAGSGLPSAVIDADYAITYVDPASRFDVALSRGTHTGIAMETTVSGSTLSVKVRTQGDADYEYETGLAVWLIENNLIFEQNSETGVINDFTHNYVVRAALCDSFYGVSIPSDKCKAGQEYTYQYTYQIPADFNKDNLQVVAYVYHNVPKLVSTSEHLVVNAQVVKAGETLGYEYSNAKTEK